MSADPVITLPGWAVPFEDRALLLRDDTAKMRYVIDLARRNVELGSGGPFGAAVFSRSDSRLVALGVNSVVRLANSVAHAELMAIMRAQRVLGAYALDLAGGHELFTSCEPCAMCLGGVLWSGVRRLVCGAPATVVRGIGFDEGPVFPESYRYLAEAGIEIVRGLEAEEAARVVRLYAERGGIIYNAERR